MTRGKRIVTATAGVLAASFMLAGCGSGSTTDEDVTLTLWTWGAGLEEQADMYMKEHPNIDIEFVNAGVGTAEYEKVRNAMKAGTGAPDAFYVSGMVAPSFVASDSVVDLNEFGA